MHCLPPLPRNLNGAPLQVDKSVESELYSTWNRKCAEERQQRQYLKARLTSSSGQQRALIMSALDDIDSDTSGCKLRDKYFGRT